MVRCGNNPHICLDQLTAAHAVETAVGQHPQQARLHFHRHVADFVQKEGAAFGLFKPAVLQAVCARKRPAFMAEKFAFQEFPRNGGRIDRHIGRVLSRRMLMQGPRHHFFAGAGFSGNQHRHITLREPPDRAEHFLHGPRLSDDVGRFGLGFFRRFCSGPLFAGAAQKFDRSVDVKRLRKILIGPALKRTHGAVQIPESRHDDDGDFRVHGLHMIKKLHPRHIVHTNVA